MPHFEEGMLSSFDPHNKFDSILKTSYKWHRLNTDDGRNRTSYSMRKFVWENRISNRGEARSFCDIGQFYTYKLCSRNQSHPGYLSSNMPYLHYNYLLMQVLLKSKESQCMDCTRELGEDSAELPGIITRHNLIETEKFASLPFSETKYILHGKVYSTEPSDVHFYTGSKITFSGTTFLANLDNLDGNNLQVLDTNENNFRNYLENPVNTVIACYEKSN
ncbi:hypothetical protein CU097_006753 [Rhizopus azygosporus]|uniref:Uncharacterized protein n=1 Tax=Rhizopus azygosporus TaxID=86630 RepID=A0A367JM27_RHIAZ|nr:hypothetical protein CU097_006753 [Rhizopus azygosporus]